MPNIGRYSNKAGLTEKRRKLRSTSTEAEKELWYILRSKQMLGYKFRRQYSIENYIVDFYCHELKLIIELDGSTHTDEKWLGYDQQRQKHLESLGFTVIRYTDEQIAYNLDGVLTDLTNKINKILSH